LSKENNRMAMNQKEANQLSIPLTTPIITNPTNYRGRFSI